MNLREIRKEKGMTQKELSSRTGINQNNISRYETGAREPSLKVAKTIATELGCTVDAIIGEMENRM